MSMRSEPMVRVNKSDRKDELFTPKVRAEIDRWIAKYPEGWQQSACIAALMEVQDMNGGHLTRELMDEVAEYLDMPPIAVYEVASFYSMFEHKPVGRHKICLCTNVSCMINGSDNILEHISNRLGISFGQVTADGRFSLKEVECLGACGGAPCALVNEKLHENLTAENFARILDGLD